MFVNTVMDAGINCTGLSNIYGGPLRHRRSDQNLAVSMGQVKVDQFYYPEAVFHRNSLLKIDYNRG
jgi:hypothetical protein